MIILKYTQGYSGKKSRFGAGFYVVIALCLLIIGGASWFALSNMMGDSDATPKTSSGDEYKDKASSYIESEENMIESKVEDSIDKTESVVSEITAEQVSDEPYSSDETVSSTEKKVKAFTMPVQGEIIKDYSDSQLQYSATYGDMRLHSGVDIACEKGTSVSACSDGTVLSVDNDATLGNVVTIDHGDGITVRYAALENLKVEQGTKVQAGDIIGTVTTIPAECNDKSHLHIEVSKNGEILSPLKALGLN